MVDTAPLPSVRPVVIVVGTTVRKNLPTLRAHLDSLEKQDLPPNVQLVPVYVPDWPDPNDIAAQYLTEWVAKHDGHLLRGVPTSATDYGDTGATHHWTNTAMRRVGANKNRIIAKASDLRADYIWFVDSDLILDRTTLWSLYHVQQPIVCGVYWTRWWMAEGEAKQPSADPQVWLRHPYQLSGRGLEEAEFRDRLARQELTQVWGQGANTLIAREVWEKGVSFDLFPGASTEGMMAGEDRHFCLWAESKHIPMYADPWSDIFHIYHKSDVNRIGEMSERLWTEHPQHPSHGDLVSLILQAVEPVQQPNRTWVQPPPQHVRGRLGSLSLMPELEAEVMKMSRGEARIIPAQCLPSHPIGVYRGQKRLFSITLVDCKPYRYAPVLEEDTVVSV